MTFKTFGYNKIFICDTKVSYEFYKNDNCQTVCVPAPKSAEEKEYKRLKNGYGSILFPTETCDGNAGLVPTEIMVPKGSYGEDFAAERCNGQGTFYLIGFKVSLALKGVYGISWLVW